MLIRHLSFFVTLAEEMHFGRAAEICNVAQPTLSAAIRKLEEDLNTILIVRSHRYVGLTPDGERALKWGRQILTDYSSLRHDLATTQSGLSGTLRLGVIPAAMPSVSFLTSQFHKKHPKVQVEIRSMTSRAIQHGLELFELDGGVTYLENEPLEDVLRLPLYRERYIFMCGEKHPFSKRNTLAWLEAAAQPLCLLSDNMQNRRILNDIATSVGLTIDAPIVSNSFLAVCAHLRSGEWCSIVPHTFLHIFGKDPDLRAIELTDPEQTQLIGLVLSNRVPRSPMANALVNVMHDFNLEMAFDQTSSSLVQ